MYLPQIVTESWILYVQSFLHFMRVKLYAFEKLRATVFKMHLKLIGTGTCGDHGPQIQASPAIQF